MKIVWTANHHAQPTGYATIARNVIPYIQNNSKHSVVEFAISGISRMMPYEWEGVKVYGPSPWGGQFGLNDWQSVQILEKPDIWMLNFDLWATGNNIPRTGIKYVTYVPIDHDPLPPVWEPVLMGASSIVPYCAFGERVLKEGLGMAYPISAPIPHGVDTTAFRPMEVDRRKIFMQDTTEDVFIVGIFKNNQGTRAKYEIQLQGFKMFLDEVGHDQARLYLHTYKKGNTAFDLTQLVKMFGLEGKVYMVNSHLYKYGLSNVELAETYNGCDVILNAVAGEGFGLPIIEAFACGKPVIATACTSMSELLTDQEGEIRKADWKHGEFIDAERGWLVPTSGDEYTLGKISKRRIFRAEDVAAALLDAYEHPEKREAKGKAGYEWGQQLDWQKIGDKWVSYFDDLEEKLAPKKYTWSGNTGKDL